MGAFIVFKEEVVGHHVECECGYEGDYHNYEYGDFGEEEEGTIFTCPECGKTSELEGEWRN
ncbi:MAG: hypothetical protein ACOC1K_00360 [Nanoarchaeota archaeon]